MRSDKNKGARISKNIDFDKISNNIFHVPTGYHYLILYPDLVTLRNLYSNYIKKQITEQYDSVILFLSYYDTTEIVRKLLSAKGINVKELEAKGELIILDIMEVLNSQFFEVPNIERLRELTRKIESQFKDRAILVIGDMSVFNHIKKSSELLDYEKNLHKDLKVERWKELCFYHEKDFDVMFTTEQKNELMDYHKDRTITIR